jgi:hypothetical protein
LFTILSQLLSIERTKETFSRALTSININADAAGTAVLVGCAAFSIADFLLDYRGLLFDEIRVTLHATWREKEVKREKIQ